LAETNISSQTIKHFKKRQAFQYPQQRWSIVKDKVHIFVSVSLGIFSLPCSTTNSNKERNKK